MSTTNETPVSGQAPEAPSRKTCDCIVLDLRSSVASSLTTGSGEVGKKR